MAKMVTDWFAEMELFLGMSIFIIGWPVGIAVAQATQPGLAEVEGWSNVFILTAILTAIALASLAAFYREAPSGANVCWMSDIRSLTGVNRTWCGQPNSVAIDP
jgi:MFS family permease